MLGLDMPCHAVIFMHACMHTMHVCMYVHARCSLRPPISPTLPPILSQLITRCWHQNPSDRPSFKSLIQLLASISATLCGRDWVMQQPLMLSHAHPVFTRASSTQSDSSRHSGGSNELSTQTSHENGSDVDERRTSLLNPNLVQVASSIIADTVDGAHVKRAYEAPLTPLLSAE